MSANVVPALLETHHHRPGRRAWPGPSPAHHRDGPPAAGWSARCPTARGRACQQRHREVHLGHVAQHVRQEPYVAPAGGASSAVLTESRAPWARYSKTGAGRAPRARSSSPASQVTADLATPAKFFLPRRSTSQPPASRSDGGRPGVGVGDPLVVEVGAALGHRAPGLALAGSTSPESTSRSTTVGSSAPASTRDGRRPRERPGQGGGARLAQLAAAEQRRGRPPGSAGSPRRRAPAWSPARPARAAPPAGTASRRARPRAPRSPRGTGT